jgi:hypothetical protein
MITSLNPGMFQLMSFDVMSHRQWIPWGPQVYTTSQGHCNTGWALLSSLERRKIYNSIGRVASLPLDPQVVHLPLSQLPSPLSLALASAFWPLSSISVSRCQSFSLWLSNCTAFPVTLGDFSLCFHWSFWPPPGDMATCLKSMPTVAALCYSLNFLPQVSNLRTHITFLLLPPGLNHSDQEPLTFFFSVAVTHDSFEVWGT